MTEVDEVRPGVVRWLAFIAVATTSALMLAASGAPSALYAEYQHHLSLSGMWVTVIYAAYAFGVVAALMGFGKLSDQFGRRPVLIVGLVILLAAMVLYTVADSGGLLVFVRFLQGIATGLTSGVSAAALTELHPRRDAESAAAINTIITSFGIALGAVGAGVIAQLSGVPLVWPYVVLGVVTFVVLVAVVVLVPETVTRRGGGRVFAPRRIGVPARLRRQFTTGCIGVAMSWSVGGVFLSLGASILKERFAIGSYIAAGSIVVVVHGVGGLAQLAWSKWLGSTSRSTVACWGSGLLVVGLSVVAASLAVSDPVVFYLGCIVCGTGFGLSYMVSARVVTELAVGPESGEIMSAFFVVAYGALSVPVVVAGVLSVSWGTFPAILALGGVLLVAAAVWLVTSWWGIRVRRRMPVDA